MTTKGIQIRITHKGLSPVSLLIDDLRQDGIRRGLPQEPIYVPVEGYIDLIYGGLVPLSYEKGDIRGLITAGHVETRFIFGPQAQDGSSGVRIVRTSPAILDGTESSVIVDLDTPGPTTINLAPGADSPTNLTIIDGKGDAGTNNITIVPASGETILLGPSQILSSDFSKSEIVFSSNASNWVEPLRGDIPVGFATGDLTGTYPSPIVAAITTTFGPTSLTFGDIEDTDIIQRQGTDLIGVSSGIANTQVKLYSGGSDVSSFSTIGDAITASSSGDVIIVGPGTYPESFTIPEGVGVKGHPPASDVFVSGASATGTRVTLSPDSILRGVTVLTPTDSTPAISFNGLVSEKAHITNVAIVGNGGSGIGIQNSGAGELYISDSFYESGDCDIAFQCTGGTITASHLNFKSGSCTTVWSCTGGEFLITNGRIGSESTVTEGFNISGGSTKICAINMNRVPSVSGFRISGDGIAAEIHGSYLLSQLYDVFIDLSLTGIGTSLVATFSNIRLERILALPTFLDNAIVHIGFFDEGVSDDSTYRLIHELAVGLSESPQESSFGEGDSSVFGMLVKTEDEIGTVVDRTTEAKSKTGSVVEFSNLIANNSIYFGHRTREFPNLKIDLDAALDLGSGSVVWEFFDGAIWQPFTIMASGSNYPYDQYAQNAFLISQDYQLRFSPISGWSQTSVGGTSAFWVRLRITSTITSSPQIQRVKIGNNRTEINSDGFLELFGQAESDSNIQWHKNLENPLVGSVPSDEDINLSPNLSLTLARNEFAGNKLDGNGGMIEIPHGLDTSRYIVFTILWMPGNNSSGNVEFEMDIVPVKIGDTLDGTLSEISYSQIEFIPINTQEILRQTSFSIPVVNLVPGEFVGFSYFRDGSGTNPDDTYTGNVVIVKTSWTGTFWHE